LNTPKAGRKSLIKYEIANLLFFLTLIVALGVLVAFVFRYYGTRNQMAPDEAKIGVVSQVTGDGSDIGIFYIGTKISETSRQYRSRLEIPVTDDGLLQELFSLPGVEEVTIDQRTIMVKKNSATRWESITPGVHRIVKNHLHIHY
jgi:hypothetical protein